MEIAMKKLGMFLFAFAFAGFFNSYSENTDELCSTEDVVDGIKSEEELRLDFANKINSLTDDEKQLIQKGISMVAKHVEKLYVSNDEFKEFVDWSKSKGLDIQIIVNLIPALNASVEAPVEEALEG
jgi:hypothetical protein